MDIIESLLSILENPYRKKGYKDCIKYFQSNNRTNEAEAFKKLLDDNTHTVEKQRRDDPEVH